MGVGGITRRVRNSQEQLLRNLNLRTKVIWVGERLSSVICSAKEETISFSLESNTVSSRPIEVKCRGAFKQLDQAAFQRRK